LNDADGTPRQRCSAAFAGVRRLVRKFKTPQRYPRICRKPLKNSFGSAGGTQPPASNSMVTTIATRIMIFSLVMGQTPVGEKFKSPQVKPVSIEKVSKKSFGSAGGTPHARVGASRWRHPCAVLPSLAAPRDSPARRHAKARRRPRCGSDGIGLPSPRCRPSRHRQDTAKRR